MTSRQLALRIDDIGASSKKYEIYSKKFKGLGNILFLKYLKGIRAWGPYREMTANEWVDVIKLLKKYNAKLTVGVTAAWVNYDGSLIYFPEKFPEQAQVIRCGVEEGVFEVASHGLTHCVLQDFLFRPKLFTSNRTYHREFWEWLPRETHYEHVEKSKQILEETFGTKLNTIIPPGNVFSDETVNAARKNGFSVLNCQTDDKKDDDFKIISNKFVLPFHDRELVLFGVGWLENILKENQDRNFVFVKELL